MKTEKEKLEIALNLIDNLIVLAELPEHIQEKVLETVNDLKK